MSCAPDRPDGDVARRRIGLTVAYDGTAYHGWQLQPGLRTASGALAGALSKVFGEAVEVEGASRTDAGVHAMGQAAACWTTSPIPAERIARVVNAALPADLRVVDARQEAPGFRPRFDAVGKLYRYSWSRPGTGSVFWGRYATPLRREPDLSAMRRAARDLVGRHDFRSFQNATDQEPSTTVRDLRALDLVEDGPFLHLEVVGTAFLYNMVRNLAGTLLEVGLGGLGLDAMPALLAARDRREAGPTAPARGLALVRVCLEAAEFATLASDPAARPGFLGLSHD